MEIKNDLPKVIKWTKSTGKRGWHADLSSTQRPAYWLSILIWTTDLVRVYYCSPGNNAMFRRRNVVSDAFKRILNHSKAIPEAFNPCIFRKGAPF